MATKLNSFREQYPQYQDVDDESLAEAVRQKFYPDMDLETYRSEIGLGPSEWTQYPKDPAGFTIDPTRPEIKNPDGSTSTERTIGIELDGRQVNVPTIVDGKALDPQDPAQMEQIVGNARNKMQRGWKFPNFDTIEEADAAAKARSDSLMPARVKWQQENSPPPSVWDRVESMWEKGEQTIANILEPDDSPRAVFEPDPRRRQQIRGQLDPINQAPNPPALFRGGMTAKENRTKKDEDTKHPRAPLGDQFSAGVDEMYANYQTATVFDSIENYQNAEAIAAGEMSYGGVPNTGATGAELDDKIRGNVAKYGNDQQRAKARAEIERKRDEIMESQVQIMQQAIDKGAEARARAATVPYHKETMDMLEAETFGESMAEFTDDPIMIIAETSLRSLPNMAEAVPLAVAGAITMGPGGFMAGMGYGAARVEYRASFAQFLETEGVDVNNARSLVNAGMDQDLMRRAHEYSQTRSGIIGLVNVATGGIATKPLTPFIKNAVGRELSNVAAQTVVQGVGEGGGEFLAQKAVGEYEPGEIMAEVTGGLAQAPIEVGAATVTGLRGNKLANELARMESDVNQMLGRDNEGSATAEPTPLPSDDPFNPQPPPEPVPRESEIEEKATKAERAAVADIPTVDAVKEAIETVGEEEFARRVAAYNEKYKPPAGVEEAVGVEVTARNIVAINRRNQAAPEPAPAPAPAPPPEPDIEIAADPERMRQLQEEAGWLNNRIDDHRAAGEFEEATKLKKVRDQVVREMSELEGPAPTPAEPEKMGPPQPPEVPGPEFFPGDIEGQAEVETPTPVEPDGPIEYFDQRLKRHVYRDHLLGLADELTPGGGIAVIWEGNHIVGRTPSVNPEWFQAMNQDPDYRMSVDQVQRAIRKAVTGKKLGVREARVVQSLTDTITDERLAQVDYAKEDLQRARDLRSKRRADAGMQPDPELENAGEQYSEDEYAPEMSADSRIIFEMMERALEAGVSEDVLERLSIKYDDTQNQQLMDELQGVIDEQRRTPGTQTAAAQQPTRPTTEKQGDIFGDDLAEQQAIQDEIRRRDAARVAGQDSVETGDAGDLFSQARQQRDIFEPPDAPDGSPRRPDFPPDERKPEKVVLIACCKTKAGEAAPAGDLYQSQLFKANLEYARSLGADRIMVLSAEHGPVELDQVLEPYDTTLKDKSRDQREMWGRQAYNTIATTVNVNGSEFIFLAGKDYRDELGKLLGQHPRATLTTPFEGMGIGQQLGELKRRNDAARGQVDQAPTGTLDMTTRIPPGPTNNQTESTNLEADRRARLERLSMAELVELAYTDPMTGIGNRLAFDEEIAGHNFVASIDGDSLKWINDNLGHDTGDAMLIAIADAMKATGLDSYRIGGDEFYLGAPTRGEIVSALALIDGQLANQELSSANGSKKGIEITAGIGTDKLSSDSRMEVEKKRKKARGAKPENATLSSVGPVLDMQPGTNYVPIIGQTGALPIDANHNLILGSTGKPVRIPKKPVRRENILAIMQKYFGKRIYQGRVKGKMRLGFYRPGQGELRLKKHNDVEVAAHEIAHWLDDRYPWIKQLYDQHLAEIKSVSYDVKLNYEGYAEFMRLWFTQESEAMQRAPSFYDAFNKSVQEKSPQMWKMLTDLQELMHAWNMQGARARGLSKVGTVGAPFMERIRRLANVNIYQGALDGLRSIKTIAADLSDISSPIITDAYNRLRLAIGGANGVIEAAFFFGTPKWKADHSGIELGGDSLMKIFGDMWGDDSLAMYMIARRAEELIGQGRENLMRPDEIAAWLQYGDTRPEFAQMFDQFQEYNNRILDFAEDSGILNPTTRRAFQEMNKNYVPFHRVIESNINGKEVQQGGNPFQRLTGGTQNINNIYENIINNTGHIIRMSMVNDGKRALYKELSKGGRLGGTDRNAQGGIYAAPISKDTKPVQVHSEQVLKQAAEAMGVPWRSYKLAKDTGMYPAGPEGEYLEAMVAIIDSMAAGLDEMVTFWKFNQDPTGDNVDYYMDGGDKFFMEINDPNLMDTMRFLSPKGSNLILAITGGFSATLRRGVVAVPVFQVKNFARDTVNAWLLSDDVKVPAGRALGVVFSRMSKDPDYIDMLLNGGGFANRSQGLQAQRKVIVDPTRLSAAYDRFMGRFENANRLAEYKAARKAGKTSRQAALASREISTDFAMRGSWEATRYLAISIPFLNARVQGLYRVKRQFDRKEQAVSYAIRGMALAGATLALYAYNREDERYKEMPEDIKDLYWVFFTGDGEDDYYLIPKPFESGMLFGTIPERMMEYTRERDGDEFADALLWMFLETFNMDFTPQVFQPQRDLEANKNFTGAKIIPNYLQNVEPTEQYTYYTSTTVREAAQAMGISPIKMEYRLRGYLGTLGTYGIAAADAMITAATDPEDRPFGEKPSRGDTWRENIITKALIDPLVQEGPLRRTKYTNDLWEMIREAEKVAGTVALHQKRNAMEIEDYLNNPEKMVQFGTNQALGAARDALGAIRVGMDQVRMAPADVMGADEKRQKLWELTRQRNKLARESAIAIKQAQEEEQARIEAEQQQQQQQQQQRAAGAQ